MKYILEITTKIGCSNVCEYCPQTKLIKNYTNNLHNAVMKKHFDDTKDLDVVENLLLHKYLEKDKNRDTMMSLDTFKRCLSTIPNQVDIHFTGYTEAFENPQCIDMIEHVSKKGHRILCNTTLVGLTPEIIKRLENIRFKEFNIHLPSATYYENIGRTSKKQKSKTGKDITDEYLDILDHIIEAKINADHPKHFHTHSGEELPDLHPEINDYAGDRIRAIGYKNRGLNSRAGNLGKLTGELLWENNWCQRIIHNVLLPDGTVQLCCQDYGLEEPLGNLNIMNYADIFETNNFKNRIMKGKTNICNRCDDGVAVPDNMKKYLASMQYHEDEWRKEQHKRRQV